MKNVTCMTTLLRQREIFRLKYLLFWLNAVLVFCRCLHCTLYDALFCFNACAYALLASSENLSLDLF